MIKDWEILHYPSAKDPNRYRVSLLSDGADAAKLRNFFPGRVGTLWIPRRKPYNCAFFLYRILPDEKNDLEQMLTGTLPFPDAPEPFLEVKALDKNLSKDDTQEVALLTQRVDSENLEQDGTGSESAILRTVRVGCFSPEHFSQGGDRVHEILSRMMLTQKLAVRFEKVFSISYDSLSLSEIQKLIKKCKEESVVRVIAIGEPVQLSALQKIAQRSGILVKVVAESILDKNLWNTLVAELISHGD